MVFKTDLVGADTEIPMTLLARAVIPSDANGILAVVLPLDTDELLSWNTVQVCELSCGFGLQAGYRPLGMSRYAPEQPN